MAVISIVMPAYNAERYIQQAIYSVIEQTFSDFELIVVDDCSNDKTAHLVHSIADPRVSLIKTKSNSGVSNARNLGMSLAQGEFIALLDADDWWLPQKLELQLEALKAQQAELCYTWTYLYNESTRLTHRTASSISGDVYEILLHQNFIGSIGSCLMFRTDIIDRIGGFDTALHYAEDWEFCLRAAKYFRYSVVEVPLLVYRQHPTSCSSKTTQIFNSVDETVNKVLTSSGAQYQFLRPRMTAGFYLGLADSCIARSSRAKSGVFAFSCYLRAARTHPAMLFELSNILRFLKLILFWILPQKLKVLLFNKLSRLNAERSENLLEDISRNTFYGSNYKKRSPSVSLAEID